MDLQFIDGTFHDITILVNLKKTWGPLSSQQFWKASPEGTGRRIRLQIFRENDYLFTVLNGYRGNISRSEGDWVISVQHEDEEEMYIVTMFDGIML